MVLVKILGAVDILAGLSFLMMVFGMDIFIQVILFCAGLLLLKGMFILGGDILSAIDLLAAFSLFLSLFLSLPTFILWILALLLFAKGFVSFL